jgi:outer membrane receptor protein involved in Fe transport
MRVLLTCLIVFLSGSVLAQFPGMGGGPSVKGKISGIITDADSGEPIPYATVTLFRKQTRPPKLPDSVTFEPWKQIDGALTAEDGSFRLKDASVGTYRLDASFLGYEKQSFEVETTGAKPDADLGTITLQTADEVMEGVTVTGQAETIENHVDKLVFNAENDASLAGGDATDVLRKTPMLTVDMDGNVSLRGNSSVRLLINGKPSTLFSNNVGEALKSIPADEIKKVEVITVPGAKYEGEGSGGIVNIITKKTEIEGFKGTVNTRAGIRGAGGGLNLNLGAGRFGLNGNIFGNKGFYRDSENYLESRAPLPDGTIQVREQESFGKSRFDFLSGRVGAFYDFNAYNSLNTSISLRGFGNENDSRTFGDSYLLSNPNQIIDTDRIGYTTSSNTSFDWSTDFRRTFEGSEREYSAAIQVSGTTADQDINFTQTSDIPIQEFVSLNANQSRNMEYTYQLDAVEPIGSWGKLEVGGKAVIRRLASDYEVRIDGEIDPNQTNEFDYNQDVWAGYTSLKTKFNDKWSLVSGLRYEHTTIGFDFADDQPDPGNEYQTWLPSGILSYNFTPMTALKGSFTRRIQRPSLWFLNPFVRQNSPQSVSQGEPTLEPEITDQYELSFNTLVKQNPVNFSVFHSRTTDVIEGFTDVRTNYEGFENDTLYVSSFINAGSRNAWGYTAFTNVKLAKWASVFLSTDGNYATIESPVRNLKNSGFQFGGNIGFNFTLKGGWKIDAFTFYRSRRPNLQGQEPSYAWYNFGFQKEIFGEKGSIGLNAGNPFGRWQRFENTTDTPTLYQRSVYQFEQQDVRLTFRYSFGDMKFRQSTRRSKINNTDAKDGGGGQGEGN